MCKLCLYVCDYANFVPMPHTSMRVSSLQLVSNYGISFLMCRLTHIQAYEYMRKSYVLSQLCWFVPHGIVPHSRFPNCVGNVAHSVPPKKIVGVYSLDFHTWNLIKLKSWFYNRRSHFISFELFVQRAACAYTLIVAQAETLHSYCAWSQAHMYIYRFKELPHADAQYMPQATHT